MDINLRRPAGAPVLRVGHRGARGHAPENTLASFNKGLELGAHVIELDVHVSRDGELVVMHDHAVDRTTDGKGLIKDLTLAELKALDAGSWYGGQFAGEQVPTLAETLGWAREHDAALAIEIKNGPIVYPGIVDKLVRALHEHNMLNRVILISFDHFAVRQAKMIAPEVLTGILYVGGLIDPVGAAGAAGADAIHPNWSYVTPALVEAAHEANLTVSPWTPNDLPTIRMLANMGVDSIGSDYPDLFDQI